MARKTKTPDDSSADSEASGAMSEVTNVIPFRKMPATPPAAKVDGETMRLLRIADEIDAIILRHLTEGTVEPRELAGVISHRLGTLMRHLEEKEKLIEACQQVIEKQAAVDE